MSHALASLMGQSVGVADQLGHRLQGAAGTHAITAAHHAFVHAADQGLLIAAAITLAAVILAAPRLPGASSHAPVGAAAAARA